MKITKTAIAIGVSAISHSVSADFLKDSKASLETRNYYFSRDFRQANAAQSKAEEWAQGFLLRYESGFTDGPVGVGVDALGLLGVKLDSSPDRSGTGLLKRDRQSHRAQGEYGELGLTAKLRLSKSVLKVGNLIPRMPVLLPSETRLLPQTFQGVHLNSQEFDRLSVDLGQLQQVNQRDSSDYEDMSASLGVARGIVLRPGVSSDAFNFAGATYKWSNNLTTSYHFGQLEHFYQQHYLNLTHVLPLGQERSLKSDLRYARATHEDSSNIDNTALGAMFTYSQAGHALGLGYQGMSGRTGFATINGADAYLVNSVQYGDFANRDERSWQVRYDFDFASVGVPGLTFMTRYLSGSNIDLGSDRPEGKEWERNTDLAYVIQSGPLKNLGVKVRNASVRTRHFGSSLDENRLIFSYTLPLL